ncbi:MAG: lipoyl(octanoyl) transferase LipB [Myxococcaceae bacterium]
MGADAGQSLLWVYSLPRVEYVDGLVLQQRWSEARAAAASPDVLLLLEHPPVLTLGRGAKPENILLPRDVLAQRGVAIVETDRGGDVTYHGPGQCMGYPLLQLEGKERDVRQYVRKLEEVLIRTLDEFGIGAGRDSRWPGVWVRPREGGQAKIAQIGVHISRWRTTHGFALNVDPNLEHFEWIVPCGIQEASVTSMVRELGHKVAMPDVADRLVFHFAELFGRSCVPAPPPSNTVSVVVMCGERVLLLRRQASRGGFWQPVTGRIEPGESAQEAARREVLEETGLRVDPVPLGYVHAFAWGEAVLPRVVIEEAYWAQADATDVQLSGEHDKAEWLSTEEALSRLSHAGLREALMRVVRRQSARQLGSSA